MSVQALRSLSSAEYDTLWCLFRDGPIWDGNLPSKSGRDSLVDKGYVERGDGWQWLTRAGIYLAIGLNMDRKKGY